MKVKDLIIPAALALLISCSGNIKADKPIDQSGVSGIYTSALDPNSCIEIKDRKYYMHYRGEKTGPDSIYNIKILDMIEINGRTLADGKYLQLSNKNDTLKYRILIWNRETIRLIYLERGNELLYIKKKK